MGYEIVRILPTEKRMLAKVDALLEQEGIRRDANLDYICGLMDEDYNLAATGSCFGNTLRCLAVSGKYQGEGLMNQVMSHLLEYQAQRGNLHVFLYTKYKSAKFFADLGFYEITRVDGNLVFMENRRTGFSDYCNSLKKTYVAGSRIASIVMNANPFTKGHRYLVETAAKENDVVHLFVVSENAGPIPFQVRKQLVMEGVKDLKNVIIHETGPYIISSSTFPSYFLKDEATVIKTHASLDIEIFSRIAEVLGIQHRYVGSEKSSLVTSMYNEEMSQRLPAHGIEVHIIDRLCNQGEVISASTVRQAIHDNQLDAIKDLIPASTYNYFASKEAEPVVKAIQSISDVKHY